MARISRPDFTGGFHEWESFYPRHPRFIAVDRFVRNWRDALLSRQFCALRKTQSRDSKTFFKAFAGKSSGSSTVLRARSRFLRCTVGNCEGAGCAVLAGT
jgi:hypothetical protein